MFRAFPAILTGSQSIHANLRAEICRYIVVQVANFTSRYLETKFESNSAAEYLKNSLMDANMIWGTDVEIVALADMLGVDVFVSKMHIDTKKGESQSTWYRYQFSHNGYTTPALYLVNRSNHYKPVIDLINCRYSSFLIHIVLAMELSLDKSSDYVVDKIRYYKSY